MSSAAEWWQFAAGTFGQPRRDPVRPIVESTVGQRISICPSPGGQGVAGSNPVIPTHRPSPVSQVGGLLRSSHGSQRRPRTDRLTTCGGLIRETRPRPAGSDQISTWSAYAAMQRRPYDLILGSPRDARRAQRGTTPPGHHGAMCGARSHGQGLLGQQLRHDPHIDDHPDDFDQGLGHDHDGGDGVGIRQREG